MLDAIAQGCETESTPLERFAWVDERFALASAAVARYGAVRPTPAVRPLQLHDAKLTFMPRRGQIHSPTPRHEVSLTPFSPFVASASADTAQIVLFHRRCPL